MTLKSVVLPAPLGPTSPTISCSVTFSETPSSARSPPNCTAIESSSSMPHVNREGSARAPEQQRHQSIGAPQDHQDEESSEHDLVTDRHDFLEHQLVEQVDDDGAHERPDDAAIAAEDRCHDRQHGPESAEGIVR